MENDLRCDCGDPLHEDESEPGLWEDGLCAVWWFPGEVIQLIFTPLGEVLR